ncbi:MAG: GGDEF domain-containing protein, partial [Thiovulaceae bacterium]|nr:GGDEF domain-containing protein [Sulfurimonadaceae bacterium]
VLTERLENYHRYGHLYSIIMLDIDFFKKINDGYGHGMGDKVLIDVAQLTQNLLRKNDLLARYGGEEFVIVLPNTNEEEARLVAEKIRSTLESAELIEDHKVTASFGICQIRDNETTKSLIECADAALYSSKESGRNRVTLG